MRGNKLFIVIPCYNEEEVIEETAKRLDSKLKELTNNNLISKDSKVLFVNDGSKDNTWNLIEQLCKNNSKFLGISLSRNFGHQNALFAGLTEVNELCDMVISMDADLQDDIDAIDDMIEKYYAGNDIVYGIRKSRKKDTFFKRNTAKLFYKLMNFLGTNTYYNHADYRLISKKVLNQLKDFKEVNLFLRGIFPYMGFKTDIVYYDRNERYAGVSKYPFKKMINFALEGISSFSIKPLRLIFKIGFLSLIISILIMIYALIQKINNNTVDGWTFITISIWFIGGVQMICMGIIGEYIGKMYFETKERPRFIIEQKTYEKGDNSGKNNIS